MDRRWVLGAACLWGLGCGSEHGVSAGGGHDAGVSDVAAEDVAMPDASTTDAADAAVDGAADVEAGSDAEACLWSPYADGLAGAALTTVAFDPRSPTSV